MPKITALLHTYNDASRIDRALDSLRAFDEVLVIDHSSTDDSIQIAHQHGATVKNGVPGVSRGVYAVDAQHDWVFCLLPNESISESLEAALFEWKQAEDEPLDHVEKEARASHNRSFSAAIRAETDSGWQTLPPETRLVNRKQVNWNDALPGNETDSVQLNGEIMRFRQP